jgi:DNA-binding transcriptional MerR regulator
VLIGEVAARTGVSARMLRHYDRVGLVSPSGRTASGYRHYEQEDLTRLLHVEGLRALGLTLAEAAEALRDMSFDPMGMVDELAGRTRERIAHDQELLGRLEQARASGPAWSDVLHTVALVRGLAAGSPSARQRAALALAVNTKEHDTAVLVEAALAEADPHAAGALLWAVARAGEAATAALAEALASPDPRRRRRAVEALVKIGSPDAVAALTVVLDHPDPRVSGRAALFVGARGEPAAVPRLVELVVDGEDDVEASSVLGTFSARDGQADPVTEAVVRALDRCSGPARLRLTAALGDIRSDRAREVLGRLQDDPDRAVALTAAALARTPAAVERAPAAPEGTPTPRR